MYAFTLIEVLLKLLLFGIGKDTFELDNSLFNAMRNLVVCKTREKLFEAHFGVGKFFGIIDEALFSEADKANGEFLFPGGIEGTDPHLHCVSNDSGNEKTCEL